MGKTTKSVSLVLGSGGARGLAHIGVIRWLEENDYKIESISGCSIGALVGGIYAAGKLEEFESWVCAISRLDMVALLDLSWSRNGLVKGDKIINTLVELVGDLQIEDLDMRFTAVAADVNEEKEVWINSGSLFDAIRASISLPLFFTPHQMDGKSLIDGGVLNPLPIAPIFSDSTDISIAVNLCGKLDGSIDQLVMAQEDVKDNPEGISAKITHYIQQLKDKVDVTSDIDWGAYDIANLAFDAMQGTITRQKIAAYPPDVVIEIARNACGIFEFERSKELVKLGYDKAQACLG